MRLRPVFRPLIKHHIGDGRDTSLWFDNWMPMGPIHEAMGNRVIYDSGLPRDARVQAIIHVNRSHWPVANSTELITLKELTQDIPPPDHDRRDRTIWCPSRRGNYTTSSAWNYFRVSKSKVDWYTLVWFHGRLPRAAFFLWLPVKGKLGTQDRLFQPVPGILCLFCGACLETHDHLFFACPATKQIWARILHKGNFSTPDLPWKELVCWMTNH